VATGEPLMSSSGVSKPVSVVLGLVGGLVAGMIFKQAWKLAARQDDTPDASDLERGWTEVLLAAGLEGAIAGVVKATLNRGYLTRRASPDEGEDDDGT
jgi:Protein of unknown function (DUF4235)